MTRLEQRLQAIEAKRVAKRAVEDPVRVRDMTDQELMELMFCNEEPGWDISGFQGDTLAEKMETSIRVFEGKDSASPEVIDAARGWFLAMKEREFR